MLFDYFFGDGNDLLFGEKVRDWVEKDFWDVCKEFKGKVDKERNGKFVDFLVYEM